MRVLIVGGQGFIGLNVAEQLLLQGHVVALFGPNSAPSTFKEALSQLPGELNIMEADVSRPHDVEHALQHFKPERVLNSAAITAGLDREKYDARRIFEVNLLGTIELLEACLRHRIPRVVQLGTRPNEGWTSPRSGWVQFLGVGNTTPVYVIR